VPALLLRLALRCHWHFAKKHTHAWPFPLALTLHLSLDNIVPKGNNIDDLAKGLQGLQRPGVPAPGLFLCQRPVSAWISFWYFPFTLAWHHPLDIYALVFLFAFFFSPS